MTHGGIWNNDDYALVVTGNHARSRRLRRKLYATPDANHASERREFTLEDIVTNESHLSTPCMIIYHCNFGWPMLSETARIEGDFASVTPRDTEAEKGKENALTFDAADAPATAKKCYWLDPKANADSKTSVALVNPSVNLRATLAYDKAELPCLTEWKQMGQGVYTVGIEPGNVLPTGRASYLEHGDCPMLAPSESRRFAFEFSVESIA